MAEGTGLQELTRNTKVKFHEFRESMTKMDDQMMELETKVNSMQKSLKEANDTLQGIMMGVEKLQGKCKETDNLTGNPVNSRSDKTNNTTPVIVGIPKRFEKGSSSGISNIKRPKVVLAKFSGENPREWVKKCQRYFLLDLIMEDQKVLFTFMALLRLGLRILLRL